MEESYTDYKEKTNLADAYINGINISGENISNIKKLSYVNQAEGSIFVKFNTRIDNEDSELYINSFTNSTKKLMNPLLRSGQPLKDDKEGIWIDEDYAKIHNLKEGDKIVLELKGIKKKTRPSSGRVRSSVTGVGRPRKRRMRSSSSAAKDGSDWASMKASSSWSRAGMSSSGTRKVAYDFLFFAAGTA